MQLALTIEYDNGYTSNCRECAYGKVGGHPRAFYEENAEKHREDGRCAHDEADVVDVGHGDGHILADEIERGTCDTQHHHHQLVTPCVGLDALVGYQQHG